ncbi:MAG: hypothetical protein RH860_00125 [Cytophagales bacterium]
MIDDENGDAERNLEKSFFEQIDKFKEERKKHYEKDSNGRIYVRDEHNNAKDRQKQKMNNNIELENDVKDYHARLEARLFENYGQSHKAFKEHQKNRKKDIDPKSQFNKQNDDKGVDKP